jgi:methyl-accepting chemotaxis protein
VIASEVKKLSDITTSSSSDINQVTSTNLTQVETGVNIARDAGIKINEIINSVSQISTMLKEITFTLNEQSQHIESNLEITRINSQAAESLNTFAVSLDTQANQLLEIVNYFKLAES